jgi:methyltransferase (TIGR00027 family)
MNMLDSEETRDKLFLEDLAESWAIDREERARPDELTEWFHAAVPVLKFLDWKVTDTGRGFAESILPLNVNSTNQHITHQAAVILIAADYTGGIALGTLLHRVPLVGIHPQKTDYAAYLWGAKADIRWIQPSTDDLVCTARIPEGRHEQIVRRFFGGRRVLETVRVDMTNRGQLVAEANITYWVQDTHALRKNAFDADRVHVLYDHRQKTSAQLVAGLRGLEQERGSSERLFDDPKAEIFSGKHGTILARRFCLVAPQIQPMVAARTKHLDDLVSSVNAGGPCQIVNIGAGLDTRIFRVQLAAGSKVFDLDLPTMLTRRREILAMCGHSHAAKRIDVPIDLRVHDIGDCVSETGEFDFSAPTIVAWEGGSMYFHDVDCRRVASSARALMQNPASRFWMDYVDHSVVDGTSDIPVVATFTGAIRCLGEPFITGFTDIRSHMICCGLEVQEDIPSNTYLKTSDPVFDLYRFCVGSRSLVA